MENKTLKTFEEAVLNYRELISGINYKTKNVHGVILLDIEEVIKANYPNGYYDHYELSDWKVYFNCRFRNGIQTVADFADHQCYIEPNAEHVEVTIKAGETMDDQDSKDLVTIKTSKEAKKKEAGLRNIAVAWMTGDDDQMKLHLHIFEAIGKEEAFEMARQMTEITDGKLCLVKGKFI